MQTAEISEGISEEAKVTYQMLAQSEYHSLLNTIISAKLYNTIHLHKCFLSTLLLPKIGKITPLFLRHQ